MLSVTIFESEVILNVIVHQSFQDMNKIYYMGIARQSG